MGKHPWTCQLRFSPKKLTSFHRFNRKCKLLILIKVFSTLEERREGHRGQDWAWAEKKRIFLLTLITTLCIKPGGNSSEWVSWKTRGFQKCCRLFQKCQQTPAKIQIVTVTRVFPKGCTSIYRVQFDKCTYQTQPLYNESQIIQLSHFYLYLKEDNLSLN